MNHLLTYLIALPVVPKNVSEEMEGALDYYRYKERCNRKRGKHRNNFTLLCACKRGQEMLKHDNAAKINNQQEGSD